MVFIGHSLGGVVVTQVQSVGTCSGLTPTNIFTPVGSIGVKAVQRPALWYSLFTSEDLRYSIFRNPAPWLQGGQYSLHGFRGLVENPAARIHPGKFALARAELQRLHQ